MYGSNGRGYWLGHSNEHISKEEKFNRYLDTLKPRDYEINTEMKESEASLKQAEEMTGKELEWYDVNNIPAKFKKESYPTPFMEPLHPDFEED